MVGFHLDDGSQIFIYMQHGCLESHHFHPLKTAWKLEVPGKDDTVSLAINRPWGTHDSRQTVESAYRVGVIPVGWETRNDGDRIWWEFVETNLEYIKNFPVTYEIENSNFIQQ